MVWKIVLTRRERLKKSFSLFYFPVSDRQENLSPLLDKKFYCKEKWWKFFYLSCCSFWPDKKNDFLVFAFLFRLEKEISRTKILNISRFTVWEKGRFLTCRRRTNLEMPITSALANSWAWRAFHELFVRCWAVVPAENTLLNNRIKISTFCSFTGRRSGRKL